MGALEPCASSTSRTIWARALSRPTLVASIFSNPCLLMVAPMTSSPVCLSTGRLSPVSSDSSTVECPLMTTPSTGILSPGRTITMSPVCTCSIGMSTSVPSRSMRAVLACRPIRALMASLVLPLARTSINLPTLIRVTMAAAVSKYTYPGIRPMVTVAE